MEFRALLLGLTLSFAVISCNNAGTSFALGLVYFFQRGVGHLEKRIAVLLDSVYIHYIV